MVEFHVQEYANREKILMGLANSGYKISVVERPDPNKYLGKLYYIQVDDTEKSEIHQIVVNVVNPKGIDVPSFAKCLSEAIKRKEIQ
jgi:hypothetical protein